MFIAILVQQFNPLFPFETTNFRAIVENSRLLLDELYRKVVALQDHAEIKSFNDLLLHNNQTAKLKKCNLADSLALPAQPPKPPLPLRPAHVYSSGRPDFLAPSRPNESSLIYEIKFLWERCKLMKEQFESLVQSLEEKEVEQLRYFSMYDKNPLINQVMRLFTVYLGVDRSHLMNDYDFDQLKTLRFEIVEEKLLRRLDESLKSNKRLSVDALMKLSRPVGVLFSLIEIKIRLYPPSLPSSKTLKRISQLMEKSSLSEKELEEVEKIKRKTDLVYERSPADKPSLEKPTVEKGSVERGTIDRTPGSLSKLGSPSEFRVRP